MVFFLLLTGKQIFVYKNNKQICFRCPQSLIVFYFWKNNVDRHSNFDFDGKMLVTISHTFLRCL